MKDLASCGIFLFFQQLCVLFLQITLYRIIMYFVVFLQCILCVHLDLLLDFKGSGDRFLQGRRVRIQKDCVLLDSLDCIILFLSFFYKAGGENEGT